MLGAILYLMLFLSVTTLVAFPTFSQPVLLTVPRVCVEALYDYALAVPLNLDDAKAKVMALARGESVTVGDCTVQIEE
mgnify:CR=1 FL=1